MRLLGLGGTAALLGASTTRRASAAAPEASLVGAQPAHYRFKIGSLEALAVNDGGFAMPPADSPFGVGEPRERIAEALAATLTPTDLVRLQFNVLLVRIGGDLVMIDSGCGNVFGPNGGRLIANLAAAGVQPTHVTAILITHMHGDHFGGLLDAEGRPAFPNAKVFIHRVEHEHYSAQGDEGVQKYLRAFEGKWQRIAGGDKLFDGLEIVDAFGHTPGHFVLTITSGGEQLFHMVDVTHHHALSFAHPEWKLQFDVQSDAAIATRKRMLDRLATDKPRIFGAHMPFPALGRVRRAGDAYEWSIEPWVFA
ncbi:MBL fold metallo-hydrolase [Opitutales bacterium ASA1]|nr:MBL fold metallo-hydrolase [Opitutales bacterium ASA1]